MSNLQGKRCCNSKEYNTQVRFVKLEQCWASYFVKVTELQFGKNVTKLQLPFKKSN